MHSLCLIQSLDTVISNCIQQITHSESHNNLLRASIKVSPYIDN